MRYTNLLTLINNNLSDLKYRLKNNLLVDNNLTKDLLENRFPIIWTRKSPTLNKSLSGWIIELTDRINYIN